MILTIEIRIVDLYTWISCGSLGGCCVPLMKLKSLCSFHNLSVSPHLCCSYCLMMWNIHYFFSLELEQYLVLQNCKNMHNYKLDLCEGGKFSTAVGNSDIQLSVYSFSCFISVCPFVAFLKATYAEHSHIVLSCRY